MRETHFINQNKDKWSKLERNLEKGNSSPDELSHLFIEITDDLSYSRTFYPNRSVRVYLNNIAQKVFYSVYQNKKGRLYKVADFWKETVPQIIYESRSAFKLAFVVFFVAATIGVFSSYMDSDFPRVILGDDYVDMTLDNIDSGNPMAVYQDPDAEKMFFTIAQNNLMVSALCFIVGLFFGVGSLFVLIQNGIMVGAFQYLFIREGVYMESIFTIWMHGALEIPCIIIASAAGLTMGGGMVFPKTLTRLQSLQISARRGLLIMLTIAPLILLAAFIESFITRYTDASYIVRGIVIFGSFAFIINYYVVYPYLKAKKGFVSFIGTTKFPPLQESGLRYDQIKNSAQVFSDAFIFYRQHFKTAALVTFILSVIYTIVILIDGDNYAFETIFSIQQLLENPWHLIEYTIDNVAQFLLLGEVNIPWVLNFICSSVMAYLALYWLQQDAQKKNTQAYTVSFYIQTIVSTLLAMFLIHLLLLTEALVLFVALIFVIPIIMLTLSAVFIERLNLLSAFARAISLSIGNWGVMLGAYLVIGAMCLIFLFMATAPIAGFYLGVLVNLFPVADIVLIRQGFYIFLYSFMFSFLLPLSFIVMGMAFFSFRETKEVPSLLKEIPSVGVRKISYGMVKED